MSDAHQRDTFISCAELLRAEAQRSENAESNLRAHLQATPEPFAGALRQAADLERDLATLLRGYADAGPKHVIGTRLQYTADSHSNTHADPENPDDALRQLVAVNKVISDNLLTAVRNDIPAEVAEELDTLWRDADKLGRRISMIHVTMQDI